MSGLDDVKAKARARILEFQAESLRGPGWDTPVSSWDFAWTSREDPTAHTHAPGCPSCSLGSDPGVQDSPVPCWIKAQAIEAEAVKDQPAPPMLLGREVKQEAPKP